VCVSQAEERLVLAHFPVVAGKSAVVPNGVDLAAIRQAEPFADEPLTVLSVGRLERYKRVDRLIRAFAVLPTGSAQLAVIGAGPDRSRLELLAASAAPFRASGQAPAQPTVRFLGRVEEAELHRWLRTCRVLCSLSEHEAFGLAPAEALAAGAEVLLSDIPAHLELADAGPVRFVRPDEPDHALAEHLQSALTATPLPAQPPNVPDWDEVAGRLVEIYQRLLTHRTIQPDRSGAPS